MRTVLSKTDDEVGLILPPALLDKLAAGVGTTFDLKVVNGSLIATMV